ncbi:ABC transporter ATP-binding protein [Pantanalinema rosaneae CENA516]|uniref:ABC transporter ATP-binding protein n=1 Tax=Pantanalinema rosaneae TaxID=1620701 RepID=UPI003D6E5880
MTSSPAPRLTPIFFPRSHPPGRSHGEPSLAIAATGIEMIFNPEVEPVPVLKGISLTVPPGKIQMVIGPSGVGKTTLLLILAGLLTPTAGQVTLLGQEITQMSRSHLTQFRRDHLGFLPEESNLLRALTAVENIEVTLNLKGIHGQAAQVQARQLLAAVGLNRSADRLSCELSGGQQQRVAIARALAGQPDLIIADEPTSALDAENGRIVLDLLRTLAQEHKSTIVIATHDWRIQPFADQIAYLNDGVLLPTYPSERVTIP